MNAQSALVRTASQSSCGQSRGSRGPRAGGGVDPGPEADRRARQPQPLSAGRLRHAICGGVGHVVYDRVGHAIYGHVSHALYHRVGHARVGHARCGHDSHTLYSGVGHARYGGVGHVVCDRCGRDHAGGVRDQAVVAPQKAPPQRAQAAPDGLADRVCDRHYDCVGHADQLTGAGGMSAAASGCTTANSANLGAFVQATILDPATGALSVYSPLVITQGTAPAAAPVVPALPANAVVTIDFGFNGTNLTQVGATPAALQQGNCADNLNGSLFGQVSFCNGAAFFQAVATAEAAGLLTVPALGVSPKTGQPCPTTRSFTMIDQDQSDNVTTTYLLTATGQTAQFNPANVAALPAATTIVNGSDNKLLAAFLDPTLGCAPFTAPDLSQAGAAGPSQALNEIQAQAQAAPVALVPENDEMTLVNNAFSADKTNLYRSNVGQPAISAANDAASSPANYCQNMANIQTAFLNANQALLATGASPVPAVGTNLLTFLANRELMSFTNLNCANFGLTNPVTVTLDANGVATAATFNTTQQTATNPGATAAPPTTPATTPATAPPVRGHRIGRHHRHHHGLMNPSGA